MKDRIKKSVFWLVWSRGGVQLVTFFSSIVVARLLDPADYGLMALVSIWTATLSLVMEMGLGSAIIQFKDIEEHELNACFWLTMGVAGLSYLALFIAAPFIATWFAAPLLTDLIRFVGVTLPIAALSVVPDSLLRKRLSLDKTAQAELLAAVATIPVVVGLAWAHAGVWALAIGVLVTTAVQAGSTFWFVHWWPGLKVKGRRIPAIFHYSVTTLGAKVCWALYKQADNFVLGKVSGDVVLGYYTMGRQLAMMPVTKISVVVNQVASPVLAELQDDRGAMSAAFLRGIRLVALVTFPLCLGLMVAADDLVRLVLTDKWISIVPILQVLCLYGIIRSIDVLLPPLLMARYRNQFVFRYTLMLLVVMPLAFWAGAEWLGAVGVAAAWVVVYPIMMAWMAHQALSEVGLSWKDLARNLSRPLAAALVMVAVMLLVQLWVSGPLAGSTLGRLVVVSLAGIVAYVGALMAFGGPVWGEVQEVFGWLVRRPSLGPAVAVKG